MTVSDDHVLGEFPPCGQESARIEPELGADSARRRCVPTEVHKGVTYVCLRNMAAARTPLRVRLCCSPKDIPVHRPLTQELYQRLPDSPTKHKSICIATYPTEVGDVIGFYHAIPSHYLIHMIRVSALPW